VVRVESREGRGTRFDIYLPAAGPDARPAKGALSADLPGGSERILFVDDEESVTELNRLRLQKLGYRVEGICDPLEALAAFREDPGGFDLVITDLTMPRLAGDALSGEIRKIRPGMKIILCSGYSDRVSEEALFSRGVSRYIEKPVDLRTLAVTVREVLEEDGGDGADSA
jgi:DNA-binding NtrC family response regulator